MRLLVTGGAGFIGSAVVRQAIGEGDDVLVLDKLTYAGNLASLAPAAGSPAIILSAPTFATATRSRGVRRFRPDAVLHLAAESHVDRSIDGPAAFIETNVVGTFVLLSEALAYWRALKGEAREKFRFLHISTDEVFGSLGAEGLFARTAPIGPIRHTRPPRRARITWRAPGARPTACQRSSPIAPTITAPIISPRS